jgi:hypothetical protein
MGNVKLAVEMPSASTEGLHYVCVGGEASLHKEG